MKNTPEFHEATFACNMIGAAVVGLNWRLAVGELSAIIDNAQPTLLIVDAEHAQLVPTPANRPAAMRVIVLGEEYEQWLGQASGAAPDVPAAPDNVALVLYSSGTTGLPKGIMITNQNLSYTRHMATELFRMHQDSVHLVASPLFHIGGAGTGLTLMTIGGRTVLMREASAPQILDTIARERVTHAFFVPAVIQQLVELQELENHDLSSLELLAYGAAPMSEALLRRAIDVLGCGFLGCYGMTETAGTVTALFPEEHSSQGPRTHLLQSVGKPLSWATLRVMDNETGQELPAGQVGEIWVSSDANMKGYLKQADITAETLVDGGWLRTGDGAYRDEEGYFFLQDRIKDMIISGGENVYPMEVENVLADHAGVAEVAVIGVPHEKWGETVKAVVVARPGVDVDSSELIEFSRSRLAHYKCPTSVDYLAELPRTATGKVLKKSLRALYTDTSAP
jgi:long-chain acyl-CoA synthetase